MSEQIAVTHKNGTNVEKAYQRRSFAPPVDVYENKDEILIVADIPGVSPDNVALRIEGDTLTLEARSDLHTPTGKLLTGEIEEARFERAFKLPPGIDADRITAEAKHGTVLVRLAKSEQAKPRQIPVKTG